MAAYWSKGKPEVAAAMKKETLDDGLDDYWNSKGEKAGTRRLCEQGVVCKLTLVVFSLAAEEAAPAAEATEAAPAAAAEAAAPAVEAAAE
jgi:hypothetical protein